MSRELVTVLSMGITGPSLGKKSLAKLSWFGALITEYRDVIYQRRFITAIESNVDDKNVLRVPTKLPGTITGRSSSGDVQ